MGSRRADLENYRKRIQKEFEEDRKYAPLPVLKSLLPALDGLDRALDIREAVEKRR